MFTNSQISPCTNDHEILIIQLKNSVCRQTYIQTEYTENRNSKSQISWINR